MPPPAFTKNCCPFHHANCPGAERGRPARLVFFCSPGNGQSIWSHFVVIELDCPGFQMSIMTLERSAYTSFQHLISHGERELRPSICVQKGKINVLVLDSAMMIMMVVILMTVAMKMTMTIAMAVTMTTRCFHQDRKQNHWRSSKLPQKLEKRLGVIFLGRRRWNNRNNHSTVGLCFSHRMKIHIHHTIALIDSSHLCSSATRVNSQGFCWFCPVHRSAGRS